MEELIGWHGTTKANKKEILKSGFNFETYDFSNESPLVPNDLGEGVYFFGEFYNKDGRERAQEYAKRYKGSGNHIIKTIIKYESNKILDLDNQENLDFFIQVIDIFENEFTEAVNNISRDRKKQARVKRGNFDGIYIELLLKRIEEETGIQIDIVKKKTFTPTLKRKEQKLSNFPNGQEICVKNLNVINIEEW